jgi:hypothetical protein
MSRQFWNELLAWATADGTAIANTTTEAIVFPNLTIPANFLQDGRTLRVTAYGKYSTTGTPTLIFALRFGGVTGTILCKSGAIVSGSGVTDALWKIEVLLTVRLNGAAGTIMANGVVVLFSGTVPTVDSAAGAPAVGPMTLGGQTGPTTASVDLTADTALSLTADWSAASASNTLTGLEYVLEALN